MSDFVNPYTVDRLSHVIQVPNPQLLEATTARSSDILPDKVKAVLGDFRFPEPSADRPYLFGCMVLSFDGKMGFIDRPEGHFISKYNFADRDGGLTDFWLMNVCRMYADGVILGTGSLKARPKTLWYAEISDPDLIEARQHLGKKTKEPWNLIVSVDGTDVPIDHPIFTLSPRPAVLTSESGYDVLCARKKGAFVAQKDLGALIITEAAADGRIPVITAGEEIPDTEELLRILRLAGFCKVSVEAPGYCWHLMKNALLDEFILNYSGIMVGGSLRLGGEQPFTSEKHPHARLLTVGVSEAFLYTRQLLDYSLKLEA